MEMENWGAEKHWASATSSQLADTGRHCSSTVIWKARKPASSSAMVVHTTARQAGSMVNCSSRHVMDRRAPHDEHPPTSTATYVYFLTAAWSSALKYTVCRPHPAATAAATRPRAAASDI